MSRRFSPIAWLAALSLLALSILAAPARSQPGDSSYITNCYGGFRSGSCITTFRSGRFHPNVIMVPPPTTPDELTAIEARDRRWTERCRPAIRQDHLGMPRYSYSAPGCEFGRLD